MIIIICGMLGSGKTTLAKHLAKKLKLNRVSGSELLKKIVEQRMHLNSRTRHKGFWETGAGKKGIQLYSTDPIVFKELDQKILEIIDSGAHLIVESRTMPWLSKKGFKIWLECNPREAAKRMAVRSSISYSSALKDIKHRLSTDKKIYKKMYGIKYGKDPKVFDLIVDNTEWKEAQTFKFVMNKIKEAKLK